MSYPSKDKKTFADVELPSNPNLPAWVITPKEERLIFDRWRKKAFSRCDDWIKAYIECSNSFKNPLESLKQCEHVNKAAQECVATYQKQEYLDIEREILIDEKLQKRKLLNEAKKSG